MPGWARGDAMINGSSLWDEITSRERVPSCCRVYSTRLISVAGVFFLSDDRKRAIIEVEVETENKDHKKSKPAIH